MMGEKAFKVLLAEDDYYVRKYIKNIIDCKKDEFEIVCEAANGEEAYNYILENDVDIILTDIEMPIMSGLEMLNKLKEMERSIKTIIITAYEEFNYAKKALELGVKEYLLKPLNKEQILKILLQAKNDVLKERVLNRQLSEINPLLKEKFIQNLLFDSHDCQKEDIYEQAASYHVNLTGKYHGIFVIDLSDTSEDKGAVFYNDNQEKRAKILDYCKQLMEIYEFEIYLDGINKIVVILSSNDQAEDLYKDIITLCEKIIEYTRVNVKSNVYIGIGDICSDISNMSKYYIQGLEVLEYRQIRPENKILSYKDININKQISNSLYSGLKEDNWENQNYIVKEAKNYIEMNFTDPDISLFKIAKHVSASPTYLSFLFKKECNENISKYITNVRLERAKRLLRETGFQINEIGYKVGYSDPAYFCKVFKRSTGLTPGEYKAR